MSTGRRSSGPGEHPKLAPPHVAEFAGFDPTPLQRRAKAQFWLRHAESPAQEPAQMSVADIARTSEAPSLGKWWPTAEFRDWFLNRDESRVAVEVAFATWAEDALARLEARDMSDKDFTAMGKVLAELADKLPKRVPADSTRKQLTEVEARRLFEQTAISMGWTPPALVAPASETK